VTGFRTRAPTGIRGSVGRLLFGAAKEGRLEQAEIIRGLAAAGMPISENSRTSISHWERGTRLPPGKRLPIIATVYGVPLMDLRGAYLIDRTLQALKKARKEIGPEPEYPEEKEAAE